jgi:hydrogenase maturation protease
MANGRPNIAVIGLGNVLLSDDGFGPFVIEQLRRHWDFPDGVTLTDGGTPGLGLVTLLDCDVAIVVDCVGVAGTPGELRCYGDEELEAVAPMARVSPHDPALREALAVTRLLGQGPDRVLLIGVIPASLEVAIELSAPVRAAASGAVALVVQALATAGSPAMRRTIPRRPDGWWRLSVVTTDHRC